jgi:hypothetical protein
MIRCLVALALMPLSALADVPAGTQIVLLGEVHDNADAHRGQAAVIASLQPTAVLFEMLTPDQADAVDGARAQAEAIWADGGWPDFALYAPIFEALGSARVVGMAVPREINRAVFTDGPAAHFGDEAPRFGLDTDLPADQRSAREEMQFAAHCEAMPLEMMGGMVDVQRFWDASFARSALAALAEHGAPVAVVLGNGHARTDWGVPAALATAAPEVATYAIGFIEADHGLPFDEVQIVPAAERGDPCAAFAKN